MKSLTVYFDGGCAFCQRCKRWLGAQPSFVAMHFIDARSAAARERTGLKPAALLQHLTVQDDTGSVWSGPDAFLVVLFALKSYRELAIELSDPSWRWLRTWLFTWVSKNRQRIGFWVGTPCHGSMCAPVNAYR